MQSYVSGHLYKGGRADKGLENREGKSTLWSINTEIRDIEEELHWQFFVINSFKTNHSGELQSAPMPHTLCPYPQYALRFIIPIPIWHGRCNSAVRVSSRQRWGESFLRVKFVMKMIRTKKGSHATTLLSQFVSEIVSTWCHLWEYFPIATTPCVGEWDSWRLRGTRFWIN